MIVAVLVFAFMALLVVNDAKRASIYDTHGVVLVDSITFPKLVPDLTHNIMLLISNKFNVGKTVTDDIRDDFFEFADNCIDQGVPKLVFMQMLVNGAENAALAQRLGVTDPYNFNAPKVVFFKAGLKDPIHYPDSASFSFDAMSKFVSENSQITFRAPGLPSKVGELVKKFVDSGDMTSRAAIQTELAALLPTLDAAEAATGSIASKIMSKIVSSGYEYVAAESKRLSNLLTTAGLSAEKKSDMRSKLTVLQHFSTNNNAL